MIGALDNPSPDDWREVLAGTRRWAVVRGDCLAIMAALPDASVDAVVCDPPYDLTSGKRGGFMGKAWDATRIAFDPATWREALRVAKPGAYLLAFGGTRTYHRMAVAIEDAGWEIRDSIHWMYGSGFPKSLDVSKAIDGMAGVDRTVQIAIVVGGEPGGSTRGKSAMVSEPFTDQAKQWQGWGTALKPAHEPIIVARKPFRGTVAECVLQHGTGGINVDGCRVECASRPAREIDPKPEANGAVYAGRREAGHGFDGGSRAVGETSLGRWPANVVFTHSPECNGECAPGCPVAELDRQSGERTSGTGAVKSATGAGWQGNALGRESRPAGTPNIEYGDTGGASRFFPTFAWDADDFAPFLYCPKADAAEREKGCEHLTPPASVGHNLSTNACARCGKRVKANGSGDKCECGDLRETIKASDRRNTHPTVKPVALMRWLVRLVTPLRGVVLDPFTGSGTTGIAAFREGFRFIGCEQDADYCAIARARIEPKGEML